MSAVYRTHSVLIDFAGRVVLLASSNIHLSHGGQTVGGSEVLSAVGTGLVCREHSHFWVPLECPGILWWCVGDLA